VGPEEAYRLPNEAAIGCLSFAKDIKRVAEDGPIAEQVEETNHKQEWESFLEDIDGFIDYMEVMIKTDMDEITIPEQYRKLYEVLGRMSAKHMLLKALLSSTLDGVHIIKIDSDEDTEE
jgi:hypothetical protein